MSPRRADPATRARLVEAATSLSLEKGFADTAVAEICERAALTKGAFFHYFTGKEALGKAVLERWVANGTAGESAAPFWEKADPLDRVYGYLDYIAELTEAGPCGCLVGIFSQELWQSHPELRADCEVAFTGWAERLARLLEEAKIRHAPTASFDPQSVAYHFIAVFEGGLILGRAYKRPEMAQQQIGHFKRYAQSLFGAEVNGMRNGRPSARLKTRRK